MFFKTRIQQLFLAAALTVAACSPLAAQRQQGPQALTGAWLISISVDGQTSPFATDMAVFDGRGSYRVIPSNKGESEAAGAYEFTHDREFNTTHAHILYDGVGDFGGVAKVIALLRVNDETLTGTYRVEILDAAGLVVARVTGTITGKLIVPVPLLAMRGFSWVCPPVGGTGLVVIAELYQAAGTQGKFMQAADILCSPPMDHVPPSAVTALLREWRNGDRVAVGPALATGVWRVAGNREGPPGIGTAGPDAPGDGTGPRSLPAHDWPEQRRLGMPGAVLWLRRPADSEHPRGLRARPRQAETRWRRSVGFAGRCYGGAGTITVGVD